MRSVAAALLVAAGGAVVAGVSARRTAVTQGRAEPLAATVRDALTTARAQVDRRLRVLADSMPEFSGVRRPAGVPVGTPAANGAGSGLPDSTEGVAESVVLTDGSGGQASGLRRPAGARGFVPALEGIRGLAAVGVMTTHIAFVTRSSYGSPVKRIFGRLDLAVAVFFAKSGFLVWRSHARHAWEDKPGTARPTGDFLRSRVERIMPVEYSPLMTSTPSTAAIS